MIYFFYFQEHPELKLSSHVRKVKKFGRPSPEIEGLVVVTGLSPLITCSLDIGDRGPVPKIEGLVVAMGLSPLITCLLDTGDRGLMFAFVERWHKETVVSICR